MFKTGLYLLFITFTQIIFSLIIRDITPMTSLPPMVHIIFFIEFIITGYIILEGYKKEIKIRDNH